MSCKKPVTISSEFTERKETTNCERLVSFWVVALYPLFENRFDLGGYHVLCSGFVAIVLSSK